MLLFKRYTLVLLTLAGMCTALISQAAVSLDRTRVIFIGGEKSVSLSISNQNTQLPYLAQGWIENEQGEKITSPMVVLPPVQRLEPGASSQIKIQGLPELNLLSQDQESLFYFNLREIPPRSDKANTLQIALQTRVKLFYRPVAIAAKKGLSEAPWQEQLTLTRLGNSYQINNPTPYFITVIEAAPDLKAGSPAEFKPLMIPPKSQQDLGVGTKVLGEKPVLTYVNDYGGRPQLQFNCVAGSCTASPVADKK
ncbi:fimbria/pilus periplasmic chaperone [Pseudomonas proteolytica]|jgi:chaperone protein PapD|uniref:fimbria/pilus periplasmic chaperone n=1 Tax=Pseudomonas proteolytica TaxID=219574 RepID=UPI0030D97C9E